MRPSGAPDPPKNPLRGTSLFLWRRRYRGGWLDKGDNNPRFSPLRGAVISRTPPSRAPLSGAQ